MRWVIVEPQVSCGLLDGRAGVAADGQWAMGAIIVIIATFNFLPMANRTIAQRQYTDL